MSESPQDRQETGSTSTIHDTGRGGASLVRLTAAVIGLALLGILAISFFTRVVGPRSVTLYTSQDQVYADLIVRRFEHDTGLRIRPVYDSEAVKTVGLANRLLAERHHPQADVFWNNEILRTWQLAAHGLFEGWTEFGYRSRRLVINTNLLDPADAPGSLLDLTNRVWQGKVALAYPLFGTTVTHFLALRQHWGEEAWEEWCGALQANKPFMVDGNSVVVQFVGRGEAWIGMTDSDDIAVGQREGMPVAALPITDLDLLIPNSVGIVRGGPNPAAAEILYDYLQSAVVTDLLIGADALEGVSTDDVTVNTLEPDYHRLLEDLETGTDQLKRIFLR
jgi:iron(III) transport system substrate-binding protein